MARTSSIALPSTSCGARIRNSASPIINDNKPDMQQAGPLPDQVPTGYACAERADPQYDTCTRVRNVYRVGQDLIVLNIHTHTYT